MFEKIKFEYRITFAYLILGLLWIYFSDSILDVLIDNKQILTELQTVKGFAYIFITALLLFLYVKKHSNKLRRALVKAEESDKLKTAFLQNITHEIRTPLNGILGFSKLLQDKDITKEEINEFTDVIRESGNRLLEIVNNVLDISKIETGQIQIFNQSFSINSIVSDLYVKFNSQAAKKGLEFYCHKYLDDVNSLINNDEAKIHQINSNLINNAIKFTKSGRIDFGYEVKDDLVVFYIKDTGIGISPENMKHIFDRFTQVDLSITRGYEGAGIGLAICKGFVELLGGKIWVESDIHKGSTFFFSTPYIRLSKDSKLQENRLNQKSLKIKTTMPYKVVNR